MVAQTISEPIAFLINLSLQCGHFPQALKEAIVVPLHKKGSKSSVSNYRAISILPSISKIFEAFVNNNLTSFLIKNNIIDNSQHGFIKGKGLDTALSDYLTNISTYLDKKINCLGIFVDFTKAFDCVNHSLLLSKLERYGIRGLPLKWFHSYLANRSQSVLVNGALSEKTKITWGVPQGSILGPTLFIIFINDLFMYIKKTCDCLQVAYADDTNFAIIGNDKKEMLLKAGKVFSELCNWVDKNKLCISTEKTSCTIFSISKQPAEEFVCLNNMNIKYNHSHKFLGLHFNSQLHFSDHIDFLCSRLTSVCYALRSVAHQCSFPTVRQMYFGCFQSILKYGIIHWGYTNEAQRVFIIQKRAIRILAGLTTRLSCKTVFRELGILTLYDLFIYEVLCFTYKNHENFSVNRNTHVYPTRHKNRLLPLNHRTRHFQKSLQFYGCKLYNSLDNDIKSSSNIHIFKKELKTLLLTRNCYSLKEFSDGPHQ